MGVVEKSAKKQHWAPFLDGFAKMTKLQPSLRKMVPLLAFWKSIEGRMQEQHAMLEALSRDFLFTYPQMEQICESKLFTSRAICQLFHCVSGDADRFLCLMLAPTLGEQVGIHKKVSKFLDMNTENPTGHYALDLADSLDLAIAEHLFLLDRWEIHLARSRPDCPDTSQRGNFSQFRNEQYQKNPLFVPRVSDWTLPGVGLFEFDYVTSRRPRRDAAPLHEGTWMNLMQALQMFTTDLKTTASGQAQKLTTSTMSISTPSAAQTNA